MHVCILPKSTNKIFSSKYLGTYTLLTYPYPINHEISSTLEDVYQYFKYDLIVIRYSDDNWLGI